VVIAFDTAHLFAKLSTASCTFARVIEGNPNIPTNNEINPNYYLFAEAHTTRAVDAASHDGLYLVSVFRVIMSITVISGIQITISGSNTS
jgi:hypothetical protein